MTKQETNNSFKQSFAPQIPKLWKRLLHEFGVSEKRVLSTREPAKNFLRSNHAYLGWGFPSSFGFNHGLAERHLTWIPRLPSGKSHFVASSRLKRDLENFPEWFDALRTLGCRIDRTGEFLLSNKGVTAHRFVLRLANLFQIQLCEVLPLTERDLDHTIANESFPCFVSPLLTGKAGTHPSSIDTQLMEFAHKVTILSVRGNGNTRQAAQQRLAKGHDTRLLISQTLTPARAQRALLHAGATPWLLFNSTADAEPAKPKADHDVSVPFLTPDELAPSNFYLHWTRRRVGKWPDQTENEYLDDLLFGCRSAQHDAVSTLCRILAGQRLIATNDLTRSPTPVVCFSDSNLEDLSKLRHFRSHLARWDALPYGIGISKDSINLHQVVYGDERLWESLPESSQPFFQLNTSSATGIDWSQEREYRHLGDVNLENLSPQQAFVFVPTLEEAKIVARLSRWPVVVLADETLAS